MSDCNCAHPRPGPVFPSHSLRLCRPASCKSSRGLNRNQHAMPFLCLDPRISFPFPPYISTPDPFCLPLSVFGVVCSGARCRKSIVLTITYSVTFVNKIIKTLLSVSLCVSLSPFLSVFVSVSLCLSVCLSVSR